MAQTTGHINKSKYIIETSEDGSSWTNISGSANFVDKGTQERLKGENLTGEGDTSLTSVGGRTAITATIRMIYTEVSGEAYETVRALYEAGTACYLRVTPSTGGAGKKRITSALGHFTSFNYGENDSDSGDNQMAEAQFFHAAWTTATI